MNTNAKAIISALACMFLFTLSPAAQGPGGPPPNGNGGPGGPGGDRQRPKPPIETAIDSDGDGNISSSEISGAVAALKALDKNGDGQISRDEYLPPRPGGNGREGARGEAGTGGDRPPGGPEGQGRGMRGQGGEAPLEEGRGEKAQGETGKRGGSGGQNGPGGGSGPRSPLVIGIDINGDGSLDASEITNAPAALKKLDKNGDGKLTPDEYRPPRPDGQGGRGERGGLRSGRGLLDGGDQAPSLPAKSVEGAMADAPAKTAEAEGVPEVTGVTALQNPARLMVSGSGFQEGCTVLVNGRAVPNTIYKGDRMAVAAGPGLDGMLPKGVPVHVSVNNPDGSSSMAMAFTR